MVKNKKSDKPSLKSLGPRVVDATISYLAIFMFKVLDLFPYEKRVRLGGFLMQRLLSRPMGYRKRIINNLAFIYPDMPRSDALTLTAKIENSVGRSIVELASPKGLMAKAASAPLTGEGVNELIAHTNSNKPVILVSGHFGNYDAVRYALLHRGLKVGGLYRKMRQERFNNLYVSRISAVGGALFPRSRNGMAKMVRFLKEGNVLALLIDQHIRAGLPLDFMGKQAYTALSAAEMALKYDAVVFPVYGVRQPDGLSFEIKIEAPIAHSDAKKMTQDLNHSLSKMVTQHKEQWFWVHKRWK
jgi:KDO2-lipid IV(A) lauroyltransferase